MKPNKLALLLILLGGPAVKILPAREPAKTGKPASDRSVRLVVEPKSVFLFGSALSQSLIVSGERSDGSMVDLTNSALFSSDDPKIAAVGKDGVVKAVGKGSTFVRAVVDGFQGSAFIVVRDVGENARAFNFAADIAPVFSHIGCNAS